MFKDKTTFGFASHALYANAPSLSLPWLTTVKSHLSSLRVMSVSQKAITQVCCASSFPFDPSNIGTVRWYRSTFFNITILGLCNFSAPGIWGAMNSLGAGGAQSPHLVNAGNSLTFCLMVVSCYFSSVIVKYVGIKGTLILGT